MSTIHTENDDISEASSAFESLLEEAREQPKGFTPKEKKVNRILWIIVGSMLGINLILFPLLISIFEVGRRGFNFEAFSIAILFFGLIPTFFATIFGVFFGLAPFNHWGFNERFTRTFLIFMLVFQFFCFLPGILMLG